MLVTVKYKECKEDNVQTHRNQFLPPDSTPQLSAMRIVFAMWMKHSA